MALAPPALPFFLNAGVQRSTCRHQLKKHMPNVMIENHVGPFASGSLNVLFLLQTDS
jgi:hypothetical protein